MQLLPCWSFYSHPCLSSICLYVYASASVCACVQFVWQESPPFLKMLSRNDTFPYDSVAFSATANQGSGAGMSCRDAARRQAATMVCRLISALYCHFVKSHYSNENGSGKAVTEQGHGWVVCQRHSDFILPALFLNSESWVGVRRSGIWPGGSWLILLCDMSLTRVFTLLSSCSTSSPREHVFSCRKCWKLCNLRKLFIVQLIFSTENQLIRCSIAVVKPLTKTWSSGCNGKVSADTVVSLWDYRTAS